MSRLDEKFAKAGGIVHDIERHIEGHLDAFIARKDEVTQKSNEIFSRQNAPLDGQIKALEELDRKLDLLSNGGPPLASTGSLTGSTVVTGSPVVEPPATFSAE